jgi:hypothetical protein
MTYFFLPQLKPACDVSAQGKFGQWLLKDAATFRNVADSLDPPALGDVTSISSVPTIWARPLTIQMALLDKEHPIRVQAEAQWQGMLAAIALAEVRGFDLKVTRLDLGQYQHEAFGRALLGLLPDRQYALYYHDEKTSAGQKHPWQELYIFLWEGQPVGMTSPSTLVVSSEEGQWPGLPWWNNGQLQAPQEFLNHDEKQSLWQWLKKLRTTISDGKYSGNQNTANVIGGLIAEFQESLKLGGNIKTELKLSDKDRFFKVPINRGVLVALNKPIKAPERESSVRLVASKEKQPEKPLLVVDPGVAEYWGRPTQAIWVHAGRTLASLSLEDLRAGNLGWDDVEWVEPVDLFLPELKFIEKDQDNALPGALMPQGKSPLKFKDNKITPLLPINPILLNYLTPEALRERIELKPIDSDSGPQIEVTINLPLAGVDETKDFENYPLSHIYPLKQENTISVTPILELWPFLKTEKWKSYYALYFDLLADTFRVKFPEFKNVTVQILEEPGSGNLKLFQLPQFPGVVECLDQDNASQGLILLKQPTLKRGSKSWNAGIDFGTSFTNCYVAEGSQKPKPLPIEESLNFQVTASEAETRGPVLYEHFVPETFLPPEKPLPLSSILSIKGSTGEIGHKSLPILDGRFYVPDINKFEVTWSRAGLKWERDKRDYTRLFLKHIVLHLSAIAASKGVGSINLNVSYPTAFSSEDVGGYIEIWQDISKTLEEETGLTYKTLEEETGLTYDVPDLKRTNNFRTESLATGQYFADGHLGQEGGSLVSTTCIDIGGGTSDISIWRSNQILYQCSIQLAGRDLFSQVISKKRTVIYKLFPNVNNDGKSIDVADKSKFQAIIDAYLRWESEEFLKYRLPKYYGDSDIRGLRQIIALGLGGLYYYIGTILRVLHKKGTFDKTFVTSNVFLGGNGSQFLNWLDGNGRFKPGFSKVDKLFSQLLTKGANACEPEFADEQWFASQSVTTHLSDRPKDEVVYGLLLNSGNSNLADNSNGSDSDSDNRAIIAGENFVINGEPKQWFEFLVDKNNIESFEVPELKRLAQFVYDFHQTLDDLSITDLKLQNYSQTPDLVDNWQLWESTKEEMEKIVLNNVGQQGKVRLEPPFILGVKALLTYLASEWAKQ